MHSGEIWVSLSIASWDHADIKLEQKAGLKGATLGGVTKETGSRGQF